MTSEFGLAVTDSDLAEVVSKIASVSGLSSDGCKLIIDSRTEVLFKFRDTDTSNAEPIITNPRVSIVYTDIIDSTFLIGDNASAKGLAWQILGFSSGDIIVKFAQCVSDNPLDIIPESFQSWGIAAYEHDGDAVSTFLSTKSLGNADLLPGMNYGGFLVHKMKSGVIGLSVFSLVTRAPIFTWIPDGPRPIENAGSITRYHNTSGGSSYAENKRRYVAFVSSGSGETYRQYFSLLSQETYDDPKSEHVNYAALAPIFCPATGGDYAKTARYLLQGPHMYNPFDGSQFIIVGGDEVFYCDHGVCACASGDKVSNTGLKVPSPNIMLHQNIGGYAPRTQQNDQGPYGKYEIDL